MTFPAQLALVLHAHLPYVRHPEQVRSLEENWLHEAIADCYLPLLGVLEAARARASPCRLTLSLSPTLLSMLAAPVCQTASLTIWIAACVCARVNSPACVILASAG